MFSSADKLVASPTNDPTAAGAQLLFIHVICQAVEDHRAPTWRNDVDTFFSGPAFARYCVLLGWNPDWARRQIQRYTAQAHRRARERRAHGAQYES